MCWASGNVPAAAVAAVVGALLSVSGAVLQGVLRNPLAEPYMLGLVGGASLFTCAAMHFGLTALGAFVLPASAFAGSCASLALVAAIATLAARRRPPVMESARLNAPGDTVILAGFATASFTCSLQMLLLSYAASGTFEAISKWLFGDLRHVAPAPFLAAAAVLALVLAVLLAKAKFLDVLSLGADRAECLGVDTRRLIATALAVVSLATAAAVAIAGAIGFVGLVAPHFARRLVGERHRRLLPASALVGALLLVAAELAGRRIPGGLSAGVVAALFGAPLLLAMLFRARRS